jgi:ABC-type thiamine transport system substrate-binding protein
MSSNTRFVLIQVVACVALLGAVACRSQEPAQNAARTVTVYVSTDRVFSEPVLRDYEKQSGVKVNAVYDTEETKSTGLANKLLAEKARPQADVFWSNEPVRTLVLKSRDVLASYRSPSAAGIPAALVDPDGYWTGFSARIRVLAYNTKTVTAKDAPQSIFDLADPKWKGQVAMADPRFDPRRFTSPLSTRSPATRKWTISSAGSRAMASGSWTAIPWSAIWLHGGRSRSV